MLKKIKKMRYDFKLANHAVTPLHLPHTTWFDYLRIFIRRKFRGMVLKLAPGHENAIQEHRHVRLCLLIIPITIVCLNLPCTRNA